MRVYSGATASGLTVSGLNATMNVSSGALAQNISLADTGRLVVLRGVHHG